MEALHHAIAINQRTNSQFAVFMMDLDKFKPVNDSLGDAAGDELLKQAVARITAQLRESDMVARWWICPHISACFKSLNNQFSVVGQICKFG